MKASTSIYFILLIILCLPLGFGNVAYAQLSDSVPASTTPVVVRQFDKKQLQQLQNDEDFAYFEEVKPDETFLQRLWRSIKRWFREVFYSSQSSGIWELLVYVVLAAAIILVILKIQGIDIGSLFGKKAATPDMAYEVYEENIHEMDIRQLIEDAIGQRDYRKAIRLHYLQSLKQLTDLGLIHWKPGKTNRSYINEITSPELRREFEQLTSMFEYVWYGGAALGDDLFSSARAEFILFDQQLNQYA